MYAIVRCGGRQEKASVDDVLTWTSSLVRSAPGSRWRAVLVVDDDEVISDPAEARRLRGHRRDRRRCQGPKINMIHYKNKTGYRRRMGHRQKYTQVKVTGISGGKARASSRKKG